MLDTLATVALVLVSSRATAPRKYGPTALCPVIVYLLQQ
jgi:hypothetical protein